MSTKIYSIAVVGGNPLDSPIVRATISIVDVLAVSSCYEVNWKNLADDYDAVLVVEDETDPLPTFRNAAKVLRELGQECDADELQDACNELQGTSLGPTSVANLVELLLLCR